jgi:hypothetical protein
MISRIIAVLLLLLPVPATAGVYFTYAQWAALPAQLRAAYVAGSFDTVVSVVDTQAQRPANTTSGASRTPE